MVVFPNAKINLGLHITEKREDGYHNIESVFYPVPLNDTLEITPNNISKTTFTSDGISIPSDGQPNLVQRAFDIVNEYVPIQNVDLELIKNIPIGAGLGGGSSDAAFCIKGLNQLFDLNISEQKQIELASKLGADCAFFIKNKPVYATGIGDDFTDFEFSLNGYHMVLIYPNTHVSTPIAYKHVSAKQPANNILDILNSPIEKWKNRLVNDFETSVFKEFPHIESFKTQLYAQGAIYASMSGSGSSIFGIFEKKPEISLKGEFKSWAFEL